jgi:glutathione S-transferase
MPEITLVIGDKNYSSWSLRAWLALKATGAPFREELVRLYQPDTRLRILAHSAAGKVPVLKDGPITVWESLAIGEYLAERFPAARLWPADAAARAYARSVATEMHGGFPALRRELPMDCRKRAAMPQISGEAQASIERITAMWRDARKRFGAGGDMLFGHFTVADCMYAPVVSRFVSYGMRLDPVCAAYRDAVIALPAMQEWLAGAAAESEPAAYSSTPTSR